MTSNVDTPRVTFKGIVLAIVISVFVGVGLAEVLLRIAMPDWREFYSGRFMTSIEVPGHSPVIAGKPGFEGYFSQNNGDFRVRISLNQLGHRNAEPATMADGQIWVIGDSMTFGWGVERSEMYSEVLEKTLNVPVYNLASPGTDICGYQSMVARMPKGSQPRATIIGLVLENDVRMYNCQAEAAQNVAHKSGQSTAKDGFNLLDAKRFATRHSALYNFFAVALKRVGFVQNLLVRVKLLNKPHMVNQNIAPEQLPRLAASTVNELLRLRSMLPSTAPFSVMVVPTRFEIRDSTPLFEQLRRAILSELSRHGIPAIDPLKAFKAAGFGATHFKHDGHWSAQGHRLAAAALADSFANQN